MSIGHLCVFLGEVSVQVLCPFSNWTVCLFGIEFYEFFIYFDVNPLSELLFANIFSRSVGCLFVLLVVSFAGQSFVVW